jgi:hypothetical protein
MTNGSPMISPTVMRGLRKHKDPEDNLHLAAQLPHLVFA